MAAEMKGLTPRTQGNFLSSEWSNLVRMEHELPMPPLLLLVPLLRVSPGPSLQNLEAKRPGAVNLNTSCP